jgi:HSP20 family protein
MARDDERRYQMPARQQEPGRLTRSPYGWGGEGDIWGGSPFQMMRRMQEEMDRVFGSFFGQSGAGGGGGGLQAGSGWAPSIDVYETENDIVVKADIPGVEPEDLEVYCTEDGVVLRGETRREQERDEGGWHRTERRYGRFERQIPLPPGARPDDAQANFRNGVLELRIPKSEESRQRARRIPIGGTAGAKGGEAGGQQGSTSQATPGSQAEPGGQQQGGSTSQQRGKK